MNSATVSPYFAIKTNYKPSMDTYSNKKTHAHSFWQMVTVTFGEGFVVIDGKSYGISEGDAVIIPPETSHMLYVEKEAMTTYEFKFDINEPFLIRQIQALPSVIRGITKDTVELSRKAVHEARDAKPYSEQLVGYIIAQIILLLSRSCESSADADTDKIGLDTLIEYNYDPCAMKARKIIEDNFSEPISTRTVAESMFLSTSYICKKFYRAYHTTPLKYLSLLRLEKARKLLEGSDLSITEIALIVGFTDIHYFSRCFKNHTSLSPSEYRLKAKTQCAFAFKS